MEVGLRIILEKRIPRKVTVQDNLNNNKKGEKK